MSSTPLSQLGIGEQQDSFDASMVNPPTNDNLANQVYQDINMDIDNDPHASNINGEMMSHSMDMAQVPPEQMPQHPPHQQMPQMSFEPDHLSEPESSWKDKVYEGAKGPLIVFFMAFLIGLPHITRILTHFVPKLLQESGQLNITGVAVKALLISVMYAVVNMATS